MTTRKQKAVGAVLAVFGVVTVVWLYYLSHQALTPGVPGASTWTSLPPTISPAPPVPSTVTHPLRRLLGVAEPGTGWGPYATFTQETGTSPQIAELYLGWGQPFPIWSVDTFQADGALTLVNWDPDQTRFETIASGTQDGYLTRVADAVAAYRDPVVVSFAHEFNGNWQPWGTQAESPQAFVAAWRHIHDLFGKVGANNVIWVWTPNVINPVPDVALAPYWPGDAYVTWVGLVGYWTGRLGEDSWPTLFGRTEQQIARFTNDNVLIVETGAQPGPSKATWVAALLAGALADKRVVGVVYFDYGLAQGKRADWTLADDPNALAAWRTGAAPWVHAPP
jgi:hypothetical protein